MSRILQNLCHGSMLLLLVAALAGCEGVRRVDNRGYVANASISEEIVVGRSSKSEVRRKFGSPSTVSSYPPETWYYITRERQTVAFLAPELKEQQVVRIEFDEHDRVARIDGFDTETVRDMEYVERVTPTEGRSLGFWEQLLGNVGRFNTPRDATQARQ